MMAFTESQNTLYNIFKQVQRAVLTAYIPLFTKGYFATHNFAALEHL
jgi:hypothetical protein